MLRPELLTGPENFNEIPVGTCTPGVYTKQTEYVIKNL